jgi:hypothetical protein
VSFPIGLVDFLAEQPGLRLVLDDPAQLRVAGIYVLDAEHEVAGRITRHYELDIRVPASFPDSPPIVYEVCGQIPRTPDFHVNGDNTLCLGSPLGVRRALKHWPDVREFMAHTLRPYLYALTVKLDTGRDFVFGELRHGTAGQLQDLADDLRLPEDQIVNAIDLMLMTSVEANAQPCICGCGRIVGNCELRDRIEEVRDLLSAPSLSILRHEFQALHSSERA